MLTLVLVENPNHLYKQNNPKYRATCRSARRIATRISTTLLAVVLVVALATTLLAGCGDDSDNSIAPPPLLPLLPQPLYPLAGCGDDSDKSITLYSGRNEPLIGPIIERFEAETGTKHTCLLYTSPSPRD